MCLIIQIGMKMTDDSAPYIDPNTADFFMTLFKDLLNGLSAQLVDRIQKLEKSVESIEKQIATLVLGYGEQAVFMEALVGQLAFATEDQRKVFQKSITEGRKQMLGVMNDASKGFMAEQDPNLATAIADMVESELSDTNE